MSSRKMPVTKGMRAARRANAEADLEEYNKLSTTEKLGRLPKNGARKQRTRLEARLKEETTPKEKKIVPAQSTTEVAAKVGPQIDQEKPFNKKGFRKR